MPRSRGKRRRRSSGRLRRLSALIAALLLLLLTLLISWIFGRRATDDGAGREPERPRNTSVGPEGPAPRRLPLRPTRPPGAAGATDDRPAGAAERTITADTAAGVALIGGSIVASDGRPILGARVELRRALDRSIGPGLPAAFVARATTRAPTGRFEIAAPVDLGQGGLLVEILGRLHFLGWFGVEP